MLGVQDYSPLRGRKQRSNRLTTMTITYYNVKKLLEEQAGAFLSNIRNVQRFTKIDRQAFTDIENGGPRPVWTAQSWFWRSLVLTFGSNILNLLRAGSLNYYKSCISREHLLTGNFVFTVKHKRKFSRFSKSSRFFCFLKDRIWPQAIQKKVFCVFTGILRPIFVFYTMSLRANAYGAVWTGTGPELRSGPRLCSRHAVQLPSFGPDRTGSDRPRTGLSHAQLYSMSATLIKAWNLRPGLTLSRFTPP